jgi:hypothetical protein
MQAGEEKEAKRRKKKRTKSITSIDVDDNKKEHLRKSIDSIGTIDN